MKLTRFPGGYSSLYHKRKEDVLEERKVDSVENKLAQYGQKLLERVNRMKDIGYSKQLLA
jgi:hypothetical protein